MQVIITAVGPDNSGLADPIVHHVTTAGANIYEIQMYDHDSEKLFAMLLRWLDAHGWRGDAATVREWWQTDIDLNAQGLEVWLDRGR
jgi:glycine cleavage system regulatory protein